MFCERIEYLFTFFVSVVLSNRLQYDTYICDNSMLNNSKTIMLNPLKLPLVLFQAVEQDRHLLKRKLANKESEFEGRILELQNDITELSNKLASKESILKQWDREKSTLVAELNAQNARLTVQLKEAATVESQLQQQIECLKEECSLGKTNLHEHMNSVEGLRDELDLVSEKNKELERRLHLAAAERDSLANALEEASDRILLLERHAREQDLRYQHSLKDYSLPQEKLSVEDRLNGKRSGDVLLVWPELSWDERRYD